MDQAGPKRALARGGQAPLVSVVIPAFNAERTIRATLQSVLNQDYLAFEVVVIDDGSSDSTAAVVEAIAAQDDRVRLIRTANHGQAAARNRGIAATAGEFIAPLDHDDLWEVSKLSLQVEAALAAPQPPGFVYTFLTRIAETGSVIPSPEAAHCSGTAFHRLYYWNFISTSGAVLFSREALMEAGGYQALGNSDDALLQLRIARRRPIACVPQRLVRYRLHAAALTQQGDAFAKWMRARDAFEREWPDLPRFLINWTRGKRWLAEAERLAINGRMGEALAHFLTALRLDPWRTMNVAFYRAFEFLKKRCARILFRSGGPGPATPAGSRGTRLERWLLRLEHRRMERLAMLDRSLAESQDR